jgi:hypothetical protein
MERQQSKMSSNPNDSQQSQPGPQFEYNPYGPTEAPASEYYAPQFSGAFPPPPPPLPPHSQPMATPLPLGEAIRQLPGQYIKVTTKPGATSFAEEMGKAEWGIIWLQLVIYAAISGALSYLSSLLNPVVFNTQNLQTLPPDTITLIQQAVTYTSGLGTLLGVIVGFFMFQGISYGLAKLFKGQGSFMAQCYTALLFQVPLGVFGALIGFVPILGIIGSLAASIYSLVLQAFSIMAVHRLSGGKAAGVVLIPLGVIIFLTCCLIFVVLAIAVNQANVPR